MALESSQPKLKYVTDRHVFMQGKAMAYTSDIHINDAYFRANGYSGFKAFILLMVINDPILMMTHYLSGVRTY